MSSRKGNQNAGRYYRQQVLSGYEHIIQQEHQDNDSASVKQGGAEAPTWDARKQTCYQVLVPIIIEKVSASSDQYQYKILLNDDVNLLVSPYSKRGKKTTQPGTTIPGKTGQKSSSVSMVYGIHEKGVSSFSHSLELNPVEALARIYSYILGKIDATLQCPLQQPQDAPSNDDTRERLESASPPKSLGTNKKTRRGKKVLPEVRTQTVSEITALLDEPYREILGSGQGDNGDRLEQVGDNPFVGTGLEGDALGF